MSIKIKRGDTFSYFATFLDENKEPMAIGVSDIKSQIRDTEYNLIDNVSIVATEDAGKFHLTCNTDNFPANIWGSVKLLMDIELNLDGDIISSDTVKIEVEKDVTYNE